MHDIRKKILDCIASEALTPHEIATRLRPRSVRRTVANHLRWLRTHLPDQMRTEQRGPDGVRWRFVGLPPHLLTTPLHHVDEMELAALVAARGLLNLPASEPGTDADRHVQTWRGTLAQAFDRIINRAGLTTEAKRISPETITVNRFAIAAEPLDALPVCLTALICGDCLRFRYRPQSKPEHDVHVVPLRLVSIAAEWFLFAHDGSGLKSYRLTRMITIDGHSAHRVRERPNNAPALPPRTAIDSYLSSAFGATGSDRRSDLREIIVAVSPDAWPHLRDRRWGSKQQWDDQSADLPTGWRRLRFTTAGLREARHKFLGMGATVRVEAPEEMVAWMREQISALNSLYAPPTRHMPVRHRIPPNQETSCPP